MNRTKCWATAAASIAWTPLATAHHSAIVNYETDLEVIHQDVTVLEWRFINPHSQIVYEAPDADGNLVRWAAGTQNLNELRRFGYTPDSLQPGQIVSIKGHPGRNGRPVMNINEVILEDGTAFSFYDPAPAALLASASTQSRPGANNRLTGIWAWVGEPLSIEDQNRAPEGAVLVDAYGQAPEMPTGESGNYPLTAQGGEFQANWTKDYDECRPTSPWLGLSAPFLVEIGEPQAGRIHIRYEYLDQERIVWLDGRGHPPLSRVPRSLQGHSVGQWEGDTLVVETVNMFSNLITRNGIYHSDQAVLTERISRDDDALTVVRVLQDPEHLSQPIAEVVKRTFVPDGELLAYGPCELQLTD